MRIGNLKYPLLILVAVGLAVASIALDEVRAPVHDHNTHSHDASLTGQPHSPLENKLQQAVAAETGLESCRNSWDAIISPGDGSSDFREFAMFYHEIGNAKFAPVDKDGVPNPSIDPISQSQTQRPGYQLPERSIHAALGRHG